jgi:hypothetical protein
LVYQIVYRSSYFVSPWKIIQRKLTSKSLKNMEVTSNLIIEKTNTIAQKD